MAHVLFRRVGRQIPRAGLPAAASGYVRAESEGGLAVLFTSRFRV